MTEDSKVDAVGGGGVFGCRDLEIGLTLVENIG
jgi:hypothetical protein